MKRTTNSLVLLLLATACCKAQTAGFTYKAVLDTVKQAGFYNIGITPTITAHTKTNYSDIRIVDASGKWVPHLLRIPSMERLDHPVLMDMPIVNKQATATAVTYVVKNPLPAVTEIVLRMKNTTVQRTCTISGSINGNDWFIINDSIMLQQEVATAGDETTSHLYFPPSSYPYFKIVVHTKKTDPVNIINIATPTKVPDASGKGSAIEWEENPNSSLIQKDSAKTSYIRVTQQEAYQFERLMLQIVGVSYYSRNVEMYIPQGENHSFANPGRLHVSLSVSNNSTLQFDMPLAKAKIFYLIIHNNDNQPLQIAGAKTALRHRVLTAYLEKGSGYQLLTDNPTATAPVYDLAQLQNKLPADIPVLGIKEAYTEKPLSTAPAASKSSSKYILWGSIALALLALLYFTIRLTGEVNKRKAATAGNEQ